MLRGHRPESSAAIGAGPLGEISDTLTSKAPPTSFEQGSQRFGLLIMRFTILLILFVVLANAFFHRPWPNPSSLALHYCEKR
jgi:hypothetical protein